MKYVVLIISALISLCGFAQKPMKGEYKWLDAQFYNGAIKLDTAEYDISNGFYLTLDTAGSDTTGYYTIKLDTISGPSGDVVGPASATDNAITRFDGTTGTLIQNSAVTMADATGSLTVPSGWSTGVTSGASVSLTSLQTILSGPSKSAPVETYLFNSGSQTQSADTVESISINTPYNQSGTSGSTDFTIHRTETALGSGAHNFMTLYSGAAGTTERFNIDNGGKVTITPTTTFAIDIEGNDKSIFFDNAAITFSATDLELSTGGGRDIVLSSDDAISLADGATEIVGVSTTEVRIQDASSNFIVESDGPNPALNVEQVAAGYVGIRLNNPTYVLDIGCDGEDCIGLQSPSTATPGAEMGTLNNFPTGVSGDPDLLIIWRINGEQYITPAWDLVP